MSNPQNRYRGANPILRLWAEIYDPGETIAETVEADYAFGQLTPNCPTYIEYSDGPAELFPYDESPLGNYIAGDGETYTAEEIDYARRIAWRLYEIGKIAEHDAEEAAA